MSVFFTLGCGTHQGPRTRTRPVHAVPAVEDQVLRLAVRVLGDDEVGRAELGGGHLVEYEELGVRLRPAGRQLGQRDVAEREQVVDDLVGEEGIHRDDL